MTTDSASLERLHDIVVPPPVPWWPPAPGWLWLLAFAALFGLALLLRGFSRWQKNKYRREALAELARLEAAASAGHTGALAGMAALLKRTALTAYGRETVASLTGNEWFAFLDRNGGTTFGEGLGAALEDAIYRPGRASPRHASVADVAVEVRHWIRSHVAQQEAGSAARRPGQGAAPPATADRLAA